MTNKSLIGVEKCRVSQTEVMLEFVRAAVLDRDPIISAKITIDWDRLMDESQKQGFIAWVWDGICRLPEEQQPPRLYRINWGMSAQEIWDRYERQKKVLHKMIELCKHNEMKLLLLKGIGLSEIYPKPQSRPSGDIDIYLFDKYEKGNLIFGDGKNVFCKKHAEFFFDGVHVENHRTPIDTDYKYERVVLTYLQSKHSDICESSMGYYTYDPLSNLIYLIMHAMHHFDPRQSIPLRNFIDIFMYTCYNKQYLPPKVCYNTLAKFRSDRPFELFIRVGEMILNYNLEEYHNGKVELKDLPAIKEYVLKSGPKLAVANDKHEVQRAKSFYHNYIQVRSVYKYLPHKNSFLFFDTLRYNMSVYFKHLFRIPLGVPFIEGIKDKLKG